jgi:MFS family permease
MSGSIVIFAVGSALCGAANSLNFLIAGRGTSLICGWNFRDLFSNPVAVQGLGAGGLASLCHIILSDLVPLEERGVFNGLIAMCVSSPSACREFNHACLQKLHYC